MNLLELLKQFKAISPDPAFKEQSKRAILATEPAAPVWTPRRMFFRVVETGVAVALTGFFIFLIMGGFSGSTISPVQYAALDPASLHAEAQAIDMQIQLAQLNYNEVAAAESTAQAGTVTAAPKTMGLMAITSSTSSTTLPAASTSTVTIDQALESLSR